MPAWVFYFLIVIGWLFAVKLAYVFAAGWTLPITRGAIFVTTAFLRIKAFLDAVPMRPGDLLMDLGCGDARVLRAAAERYGVEAVGFEVNPLAYGIARLLSLGSRGIRIRWENFWNADLARADVIFCYLFPDVMDRLARKLEREARPGTRVVSCNFPLPGWNPENILRPASSRHGDPMYLYRIPLDSPEPCCETGLPRQALR